MYSTTCSSSWNRGKFRISSWRFISNSSLIILPYLFIIDYSTVCFIDSYQAAYIMAADKVLTELAKRYIETLPAVRKICSLITMKSFSCKEYGWTIKRFCSYIIKWIWRWSDIKSSIYQWNSYNTIPKSISTGLSSIWWRSFYWYTIFMYTRTSNT